jgi:diaminohydroxyphosphoribosylaminopyrimidine deaminase / 5-amino-6-(5-phosphoribosylamino)uracil reductase
MTDTRFMRLALRLARRGGSATSPNPMVGAVLVKGSKVIGCGWHRRAGLPHAEIEALRDAPEHGHSSRGATLFVTLEPCCTHGRTAPCTDAIVAAGIKRVVVGAIDPNPKHAGKGLKILRRAGIEVIWWGERLSRRSPAKADTREPEDKSKHGSSVASPHQRLAAECARLNEAFNHWIVRRTPFVTVKAAMTLDGKIATAAGQSQWITGERARAYGMKLRQEADAILVGINTILADDPSLTARSRKSEVGSQGKNLRLRRIVLDSLARTPLKAQVVSDEYAALTTIVVGRGAPQSRVASLAKRVNVLIAPSKKLGRAYSRASSPVASPCQRLDLRWLLKKLGGQNVTSLLVEGGGEVNASFLLGGLAHRVAFFYAPKILGGRDARKAVAGEGARSLAEALALCDVEWRRLGPDLLLTARVVP